MSSSHTNRLILVTSTITAALLAFGVVSSPLMTSTMINGGGNIFNLNQAIATTEGNGEQDTGEQDTGEIVPPPGSDIIIEPPGGGELPPTPELTPFPTGPQGFVAPSPTLSPAPGLFQGFVAPSPTLSPAPGLLTPTPTPGLIQSLVPGATCVLGPPAAGLPSCPQTAFSLTQKCVTIPFIGRVCVPFPGGDDSPPTPTPTKAPTPLRCPPFCLPPLPTGVLEETPPTTPPVTPPVTPPTIITNTNNLQTIQTVSNFAGAITTTPDCPPQSATVLLGPSTMENGGARILAAFEPCILTDGSVVLNLPDEQGIQLVAANIQAGQTTQSAVVPMQRIAPITEGQTLYTVDLNEQITGADPATGAQVTLNGNINALFLLNLGGQEVEFSGDNSVALNAILRR